MISNNLIVILSNLPWKWTTEYVNQTALHLRKQNIVVCFFWFEALSIKEHVYKKKSIRLLYKISTDLYGYNSIHFLPFRRFSTISQLNLYTNLFLIYIISVWFIFRHHLTNKIVWIFDPRLARSALFFKSFGYFLLYECVDYWIGSTLDSLEAKQIKNNEQQLLQRSDLAITDSHTLQKVHQKVRHDIALVPLGFRLDTFQKKMRNIHPIVLPKGKPILGFGGGISYRIDFRFLKQLAKRNPQWNIVLVGPILEIGNEKTVMYVNKKLQELSKLKNFFRYPDTPKNSIPSVLKQFDIGIIPYDRKLLWNTYSFPMKIFEYFYIGKPVVSMPIEELRRYNEFVYIGRSINEWEQAIFEILKSSWPHRKKIGQRQLALKNSWFNNIRSIDLILQTRPDLIINK